MVPGFSLGGIARAAMAGGRMALANGRVRGALVGGALGAAYGGLTGQGGLRRAAGFGILGAGLGGFATGIGINARNYMSRGMRTSTAMRWGAKAEFIKARANARYASRLIGNTSRKGYSTFRSMWR